MWRDKMFDQIDVIPSAEGNVQKYVFKKSDAVLEAVLYRYPDYETRTVICCSTMSGCPVGCRFCGAGDYFVRSCSSEEIIAQVERCVEDTGVDPDDMKRLQIMFMSMGEPLLNKKGLTRAIEQLSFMYPEAALLISTIGPQIDYEWVFNLSVRCPNVGLQFSIHQPNDEARNRLIPFDKKLPLLEIAKTGEAWAKRTGRRPFFNYCADGDNSSEQDAAKIAKTFTPDVWEATVSVICERNEGLPARNQHQQKLAADFSEKLLSHGFNVRVFDPAGQDDIGGGCGQLWFVQSWMKENPSLALPSCGKGLPSVHVPAPVETINA